MWLCPNKTLLKKKLWTGSTLLTPEIKADTNGRNGDSLWEMEAEAYFLFYCSGAVNILPNYLTSKKSFCLILAKSSGSCMLVFSASMSRVCSVPLCTSKPSFSCSSVLPLFLETASLQGLGSPPLANLVRNLLNGHPLKASSSASTLHLLPRPQQVYLCSSTSWTAMHLREPMHVFTHSLIRLNRRVPTMCWVTLKQYKLHLHLECSWREVAMTESSHKAAESNLFPAPRCLSTRELRHFKNNFLNCTNNFHHDNF